MNDDDPMFSRSGRTDAGGKLTTRIDIPSSIELDEALITMAALRGMPKAEYARSILERAVWGEFAMLRRVAKQAGLGPWDQLPDQQGRG